MKTSIIRSLTLLCLLAPLTAFSQIMGLPVKTLNGANSQLDSYIGQGKWTVVMYWASYCGVCKGEMPRISDFHNKHKNNDAVVVGVALDGYENRNLVLGFLDQYQSSFDNYIVDLPTLMNSYEASTGTRFRGTPTFLVFTPKGELIANNPGPVSPEGLERFIAKYSNI